MYLTFTKVDALHIFNWWKRKCTERGYVPYFLFPSREKGLKPCFPYVSGVTLGQMLVSTIDICDC